MGDKGEEMGYVVSYVWLRFFWRVTLVEEIGIAEIYGGTDKEDECFSQMYPVMETRLRMCFLMCFFIS